MITKGELTLTQIAAGSNKRCIVQTVDLLFCETPSLLATALKLGCISRNCSITMNNTKEVQTVNKEIYTHNMSSSKSKFVKYTFQEEHFA